LLPKDLSGVNDFKRNEYIVNVTSDLKPMSYT
jgi:hypothetical protein